LRNSQTVSLTIEALAAQSRLLAEHQQYLRQNGLTPLSTFRPTVTITEADLVKKFERTPVNVAVVWQFFNNLDGAQTFDELARTTALSRIQLVHTLYHLMTNGLVKLCNEAVAPKSKLTMQHRIIDTAAIQSIMLKLRRADTGMFLYPAFLYFLEQEYLRCYRARSPLSVIVFEMRNLTSASDRQVLPTAAILEAALRISKLKRHVDLIAHYDAFDFALLLPNTKVSGAEIFANRVLKVLQSSPLADNVTPDTLALSFGCATIPEDTTDMSALLGAAELCMTQSRETKKPLVMFRDIKHLVVEQ
jgi:diguanylate cyclase (GGDEF)-like protein